MDAIDDGDEICPVRDGECTCRQPISAPSLKIKLTLPPSMRTVSKKRGRPPKFKSTKRPPPPPTLKKKKAALLKRRKAHSSSSELSDLDDVYPTFLPAEDVTIPISSHSSSSSSSLSSDQGDDESTESDESPSEDSEMQAEEESFIRSGWHIKSRNCSPESRELLHEADEDEEEDEEHIFEDDDVQSDSCSMPITRGLATGWSDDEESSFDADLFFANLDASSSSASSSRASSPCRAQAPMRVVERRPSAEMHTFDVAEDWTGSVVFTNNLDSSSFLMDMDLDADDEGDGGLISASFSIRHSSPAYCEMSDGDDGDSTDQELVGADGLPTSRLMSLFRMPSSVALVDPQSTSKKSSGEEEEMDVEMGRGGKVPLMGCFSDTVGKELTIISPETTRESIPSPFGREKEPETSTMYRTRSTSLSSTTSCTSVDSTTFFSSNPTTPKPLSFALASQLTSALSSLTTVAEDEVDVSDLLSPEFITGSSSRQVTLASPTPAPNREEELKNLHRWDLISVGAYRRTRHKESGHDAAAAAALHESPMASFGAAMLYPNKNSSNSKQKKKNGDKTPTTRIVRPLIPPFHLPPPPPPLKKELNKGKGRRGEKEMGAVHHRHQNNNHHYQRSHFPNSKKRSMGGVQRGTNGQSSPLMM